MKDLIRKYKRIFAMFSIIILCYFGISLYITLRYNFNEVVRVVVRDILEYNIEFTSVSLTPTRLNIHNIKLKDKEGNLVMEAPKAYLKYNIKDALRGYFISEILVEDPEVYLVLYNKYFTNITDALGIDLEEEEEPDKKKSEYSPLKSVRVVNGKLHYKDISYEDPIEMDIDHLEGGLTLIKKKVKLSFEGVGAEDNREKLRFTLDTGGEETEFGIKGDNIRIRDELLQYSYEDEGMITYKGGRANLDLSIKGSKIYGYTYVSDAKLEYEELLAQATNIDMEGYYNGDRIELIGNGKVEDNRIEFTLDKAGDKLDINFKGKNINSKDILNNLKRYEIEGVEGIISYAEANLSFDLTRDDSNMEIKTYLRSNKLTYNNNELEELKGELVFNKLEDKLYFNDLTLLGTFNQFQLFPIKSKLNLSGTYDFDKLYLKYEIDNKGSFFKQKALKGELEYIQSKELLKISNKSEDFVMELNLDFLEGDIALNTYISDELSIDNDRYRSKVKGEIDLDYNYKTRTLKKSKGNLLLTKGTYFDNVKILFHEEKGKLIIEEFSLAEGESAFDLKGELDPKDLSYKGELNGVKIDSKNFVADKKYPELLLNGNIKFEGKEKDIKAKYDIEVENFLYYLQFKGMKVKGDFSYIDEKPKGTLKGYTDEFIYNPIDFKDLYLEFDLDNDELYIKHVKNRYIYLNGVYNLKKNYLDLDYSLTDYELSKLKLNTDVLQGKLGNLYGKVKGNLENPYLTVTLDNSTLNIDNREKVKVGGNISFEGYKLYLNEFNFKKNLISGTIDFEKNTLDLKVNLLESDLNKYYGDNNVKYRAIGQLNLWGEFDNLRAVSSVNIDNIYYRGEKLPDFFAKFSYTGGSLYEPLESGKISLTSLKLLGDKDSKLLEAKGYLDISTKEFKFSMDNQQVNISTLEYLFEDFNFKGEILLDLNIQGILNGDIDYNFDIKSAALSYNDIEIDKLEGKIYGDKEKVHIDYINMEYDNNKLVSKGEFDIENLTYNFTMNGKNIDLEILNLFLFGQASNIGGSADVDVIISNEKTEGILKIEDGSISTLDKTFNFEDINTELIFTQKGVEVKELTGLLNGGDFRVEGYYNLPELTEEVLLDKTLLLKDYGFDIEIDKMNYVYEKSVVLTISSDLAIENNNVTGDVVINNGKVLKLPSGSEEEKSVISEDEKDSSLIDAFYVKLNVNTEEGILFNADNIPLVEDIELNIEGGGILEIKKGEIYFTGRLITEEGVVTFNETYFEVSSGIIVFDNASEAFPNVNPSIALSSQTKINNEEIYINISGYYDSLQLNLSSSSGLSEEDITTLLLFKSLEDTDVTVNQVVKDILDRQLGEQIFNPISKEIERILNVSKVKISSNILSTEEDEIRVKENIILGAEIEIENPLYEDFVFWNLKAKFSDEESGQVDSFDLWLDYKINKNLSWVLGIERLENSSVNTDENNYHLGIDFKFDKKSIFNLWDKN